MSESAAYILWTNRKTLQDCENLLSVALLLAYICEPLYCIVHNIEFTASKCVVK